MKSDEAIPFCKSENFLRRWTAQTGSICMQDDIKLALDRAPPQLRDQPPPPKVEKPAKKVPSKEENDPYVKVLIGALDTAQAISGAVTNFHAWLRSPPPPPLPKAPPPSAPVKKVPPFDIQDIPGAMRKVGMPVAAKLMEKWFAGELNYSPTSDDESAGLNQKGVPYPPSMIDTTTIKMDWVLQRLRSKDGLNELIRQFKTPRARDRIQKCLSPYRNRDYIAPTWECRSDIQRLHKEFQFQFMPIGATLGERFARFFSQSLFNEGVPDDLTGALGTFNLYAAICSADFDHRRDSALVTQVCFYVKDNYTFTDKAGEASQYLGHWNRSHVATVPAHYAAELANVSWVEYAVAQSDVTAKDAVLYPVWNKDFRAWQRKHNQGGDFIIYSDLISMRLDSPIRVYF